MTYELKLTDGRVVIWDGLTGIDAALRYVAAHPEATVTAWRETPRHGLFVGLVPIVEPGEVPR